jgi:signal transduction histidine kinase
MRDGGAILIAGLVPVAIYLISLRNYLLFHSLVEVFTIVVTAGIFMVAWNARDYIDNNYLLFIGIASLFVAFLDLLHTLAYEGMAVFPGNTANLATQLWLAGRYVQGLSWLIAPLFLRHRLKVNFAIGGCVALTGLLLLLISWHIFPAAYLEGTGLTAFKKISEYLVAAALLGAVALLLPERQKFDARVGRLVIISLLLTVASEIAFTSYVSVFGDANRVGHLLRLAAFYLLYKAIIETGLLRPYAILLRDLKRSEAQLRESAAALQTQNEVLVARNEELDAYAHTVAHDLKNPLAIIIGNSDMVNQVAALTPKERQKSLKQIKTTALEMNDIIDSLLMLAEVRKSEAPMEPVNMAELIHHVRGRLDYLLREHDGRLVYPKSWPAALGYAPWIAEVWANYISNAIKYGGPSPQVELGATLQADGMIRFWTRDHGLGIVPQAQARLFTPFTQLRTAGMRGHGLGLSIVLRIVEKLGGQVGVESQPGQGSLFYFTLPAVHTATAPASQEIKQRLAPLPSSNTG